ncbi:MAG TPA: hypothetical protein VKA04_09625, partial [Pseudodesulfovibrio sp.]|nr:hypothetical protein [Pseudodesulfovibrio sp.]
MARPTNNYIAPAESGFEKLAAGLSKLQPGLTNYLGAKQHQQDQADFAQGLKDRELLGSVPNDQALGHLKPEQSAAYQKCWMVMHGRAEGAATAAALVTGYEQDKEHYRDPQAFNEYVTKFLKDHMGSNSDPDFLEGFMSKVEPTEQKLRAQYQLESAAEAQEEARTNIFSDMKDTLGKFAGAGASVAELHTELQQFYDVGHQIMGMSRQDMNNLAFEAVTNAAQQTGRPELLDIFSMHKPDGTPGLANSPQWSSRIIDTKAHLEAAVKAAHAKQDDLAKYQYRSSLEDVVNKGVWDEAKVRHGIEAGLITDSQALAYKHAYQKQKEELAAQHMARLAVDSGDVVAVAGAQHMPGGKARVRDQFEAWVLETMKGAPNMQEGLQRVGKRAEQLDMMPAAWQAALSDANPAKPQRFLEAAVLYRNLKDNANLTLQRHLPEGDAAVYEVYWAAKDYGATDEEALQHAHDVGDPKHAQEVVTAAKSFMAREGLDATTSELLNSKWSLAHPIDAFTTWAHGAPLPSSPHGAIQNEDYVKKEMTRLMELRLSWGNTSDKDAFDWAMQRFKATHTPIRGRMVRTDHVSINEVSHGALEWYLAGRAKELQKDHILDPDEGLAVKSDAQTLKDGTLAVYGESTQIPVGRVSPQSMAGKYIQW